MISYRGIVRLSKFFNINKSPHLKIPKSKSPHFFHVSHFLSPISPHYKPHEKSKFSAFSAFFSVLFPCFLCIFSTPHFLRLCYAEIRKKLRRKCRTPQRMRRSEVRAILVTRGEFYVFVLVLKPLPVEEVWTCDNFRNKLIVQLLQNEKCSDLMLGLKQTSNLSKWFGIFFPSLSVRIPMWLVARHQIWGSEGTREDVACTWHPRT